MAWEFCGKTIDAQHEHKFRKICQIRFHDDLLPFEAFLKLSEPEPKFKQEGPLTATNFEPVDISYSRTRSTAMLILGTYSQTLLASICALPIFGRKLPKCRPEQMNELKMIASPETIQRIRTAADSDLDYVKLRQQIAIGWPESPDELNECLRPYNTFSDELSTSCDLCWKGHRLIVPQPNRGYILERLHGAHSGINACLRRCRETVYWPGITADIKKMIERCEICARYQQQTQKEPLMSYPPPTRVWERVGVDIFTFDDRDYLVCVDYLSGFYEIDRLPSKRVSDITYCLRQHFARHGLPDEVVSDNSPFVSAEFRQFAARFEFRHTTSSPYWSRGNGRAEAAVKCAKRLLIKARESGEDPYLALLEWRNTPSEQLGPSPAQLLFGRRTRTRLPTANKLLDTPTAHGASIALAIAKERQAHYYNQNARERTLSVRRCE